MNLTTLGNACGGPVKITPFSSAGSVEMGIDTVKYIGRSLAVILAQHGVMTIGKDVKQALYAAVYLEECAKAYLAARAIGPTRSLSPEQIQQSIDVFKYYGQDTKAIRLFTLTTSCFVMMRHFLIIRTTCTFHYNRHKLSHLGRHIPSRLSAQPTSLSLISHSSHLIPPIFYDFVTSFPRP